MKPEIVGIGHVCKDTICLIDGYPQEDTSRHIEDYLVQPGGSASQAIAAVARLGGRAGFLGYIGDDDIGDYLHRDFNSENIDTSLLLKIPGGQSSFSLVLSNTRNASRTLFSYHDRLPPFEFTPEAIAYIGGVKYIHLDGTMYGNALKAAEIARELGVQVSLDGCSMQRDNAKNLTLVGLADILIMNETYPCRLMETEEREEALLRIARLGPKLVVSTSGSRGGFVVVDGKVERFPAFNIKPVDTTGAGDAFHGAFLYGCLIGFELWTNLRFASAVAAINCLTLGGRQGLPDQATVDRFISQHEFNHVS